MNISMMKAKNVKAAIRNGWTIENLCNKYECDKEAFLERLRQLYCPDRNSKRYHDVLDDLDANEKRIRGKVGTSTGITSRRNTGTNTLTDAEMKRIAIDILKNKAAESEQSIAKLKSQMGSLIKEHASLRLSLYDLIKDIDHAISEFKKCYKTFCETRSRIAEIEALIASASSKLDKEIVSLRDTLDEIEEMSMVTLGVYSSGDISPMDGELVPDDTGWEVVRDTLITMPECQELRLKDIGTLARLLMIVEHADCKIEVMCDDTELEAVFRKLHAQGKVDNDTTTT